MSSNPNPIAPLKVLSERAVGFFLKFKSHPPVPTEVVGVDLGHSHLLVLALEKKLGRAVISHFRLEPRPATPQGVSELLKKIFREEGLPPKGLRVVLKSEGTVIRILTFPQMKRGDLANVLRYEVEKYIPFKAGEVVLDFQVLGENIPDGDIKAMEALLVAVKQTEIHQAIELFQNAGLEVDVVDIGAFAFANLLEYVAPEAKADPVGFLDMGVESSTFGILLRGKPIFIRDISFGGGDILKLLKRRLALEADAALAIPKDPSLVTPEYKTVVEQALSGLLNELKLSLGYYLDQVRGSEPIQTLFIAGGGFRFLADPSYLEKEIKIHTRRPEIFSQIDIHSRVDSSLLKKNEDLLHSALGLCLR